MAGKFNMEILKASAQEGDPLQNFKRTKEILDKANNAVDYLPADRLVPYSKHPFQLSERRVEELTESIREQGVLVPALVRTLPEQRGVYELLAGHHRWAAAKRAGLEELPCIIKNVDDSTAALIVVESNRQRGFSDMLPSEIARALKLEYDALKCQGKRSDMLKKFNEIMAMESDEMGIESTSGTMFQKSDVSVWAGQKVGEQVSMSDRSVRYYIRLNELIPPLLDRVDDAGIAIRPAVDVSYLPELEQQYVAGVLDTSTYKVDMKNAALLREYSQKGRLNGDTARLILSGAAFEVKPKAVKEIKIPMKKIRSFLPSSLPEKEYADYIIRAVAFYQEEGNEDAE